MTAPRTAWPGNAPRRWTDAERQQLLDLLRSGIGYPAAARQLARGEADCRAEAVLLRDAGWTAAGAMKRRAPPPSRQCLGCEEDFAPEGRFLFMCRPCRRAATAGVRRDPAEEKRAA